MCWIKLQGQRKKTDCTIIYVSAQALHYVARKKNHVVNMESVKQYYICDATLKAMSKGGAGIA